MKMRLVIKHRKDFKSLEIKAAWDRYSRTRHPADKPSGSGPSPIAYVTNKPSPGAKRWAVKSC